MVITITGANDFSRTREVHQLVQAFVEVHTDMALEKLDGEEASADQMRAALQSLPFLTQRKLVVLREPSRQKAFADDIGALLADLPETTDVVIVEPKLDKRLTYYKTLKKQTDFRDCTELDANGLARWAVEYAKERGGSLSSSDARLLIDRVGVSQQLICSEVNKLLTYQPQITRKTIELMTERVPQSTVFELLDAAFAGKSAHAFELYKEQRALKVEPQAMLALLAWQLHVLAVVKASGARGSDEVARSAKLNPYVVRKSQPMARKLSLERLKSLVGELLALDLQLKSTAVDADEAVQFYLLRLGQAGQATS